MNGNQYTQKSIEAINAAQALAGEYGNQELAQAHLLSALLESGDGLIPQLLTRMGIDAQAVRAAAQAAVEKLPRVSGSAREQGKVYVTADMDKALREAANNSAGGGMAVAFRPDELIASEKPLPVVLTRMEVNGEQTLSLPPSLSHSQNYLTFLFSTLNYATPSHDRYRYRLRGLEREWNICSDGSGLCIAEYKALPPGNYTFEVQAATASGEWGPVTKKTFVICQPWWLTWWAKMLYCLMVLTIGGWLIALYLKKKKAKMEYENDQRVNRLFELREEARHQFAESASIAPGKITINAEEEKMVTQMLKAIEAHIDDEQYNADQLARDIAMSRASLYKKMQTILGITPTDFIRNVRLKRAAQLLADTQLSINEIAGRVGFVTARNFSSQFKKMFGVTPSEYREPPKNLE